MEPTEPGTMTKVLYAAEVAACYLLPTPIRWGEGPLFECLTLHMEI
jgi:hypothetical protein